MKKRFLSLILTVFMLLPLTIVIGADDTESSFRYIVPFGRYSYCRILPNGLILAGRKVDKFTFIDEEISAANFRYSYEIDMLYGLLDSEGKPLTDFAYFSIGNMFNAYSYGINADGWMLGGIISGNKMKQVLFNAKGKIVPTPDNGQITLFEHSYSVETPDAYILGVNNQTYTVSKSDIRKAGITKEYPNGYHVYQIAAVYNKYFIVYGGYGSGAHQLIELEMGDVDTVVFNYDGTIHHKSRGISTPMPDGLIEAYASPGGSDRYDIIMTDFDGNVLIPRAYGRTIIDRFYDKAKNQAVSGVYIYSGHRSDGTYYQGIWDVKNSGEFKAFRWALYDEVVDCDTENKLLYLKKDGKIGLYTFTGKQLLPFEYEEIHRENSGFIRYYNFEWDEKWENRSQVQGFINLKGEKVFESENPNLELHDFSEGLCQFSSYDVKNDITTYTAGFMNNKFEIVIKYESKGFYDQQHYIVEGFKDWIVDGFKDGVAVMGSGDYYNGFGGFSFINKKGETVISGKDLLIPAPSSQAKEGSLILKAQRGSNGLILLRRSYMFQTGKASYDERYITYGIIQCSGG